MNRLSKKPISLFQLDGSQIIIQIEKENPRSEAFEELGLDERVPRNLRRGYGVPGSHKRFIDL